jgi:hypothetical protein
VPNDGGGDDDDDDDYYYYYYYKNATINILEGPPLRKKIREVTVNRVKERWEDGIQLNRNKFKVCLSI